MKMPKFTQAFVDRHGKSRFYFRRAGSKRVPLPGLPWSPEFMAAYEAAMAGDAPRLEIGAGRNKAGTVAALVSAYYVSETYLSHKPGTRTMQRQILERFRNEHGDKRYARLHSEHIVKLLSSKKATPFAWRNTFKTLRALLQFAVDEKLLKEDPTIGVKLVKAKSDGHHSWSDAEIEQFERRCPVGTREHLAMTMLLYTLQRRGDVIRMGRQHVRNTPDGLIIDVKQQKTGIELVIPILPELQSAFDAMPPNHLTFLTTAHGSSFSAGGFTNWFGAACKEAGLLQCSAHGLRKAGCRRFAEAGFSANQIAAWSGHASLSEVQRYTKQADQAKLAWAGVARLKERTSTVKPEPRFDNSSKKPSEIRGRK
jgi:integrase